MKSLYRQRKTLCAAILVELNYEGTLDVYHTPLLDFHLPVMEAIEQVTDIDLLVEFNKAHQGTYLWALLNTAIVEKQTEWLRRGNNA